MAQLLSQWRTLCTSVVTSVEMGTPRRRSGGGLEWPVFAKYGSVVPLKLKSGLFLSLVVLLYNTECWPMRADAVEGFIYRCLRRVTRIERGSPGPLEDQPSRTEVVGVAARPHADEL